MKIQMVLGRFEARVLALESSCTAKTVRHLPGSRRRRVWSGQKLWHPHRLVYGASLTPHSLVLFGPACSRWPPSSAAACAARKKRGEGKTQRNF